MMQMTLMPDTCASLLGHTETTVYTLPVALAMHSSLYGRLLPLAKIVRGNWLTRRIAAACSSVSRACSSAAVRCFWHSEAQTVMSPFGLVPVPMTKK